MELALQSMKLLAKLVMLAVAGFAATRALARLRGPEKRSQPRQIAGSMMVGERSEIEISSGVMDTSSSPLSRVAGEGYDPGVMLSAHTAGSRAVASARDHHRRVHHQDRRELLRAQDR